MSKLFDEALNQVPDEIKRFVDHSFDVVDQIHEILDHQGKTQRDLAAMLGKKESEISKWMRGTHNFTIKSIAKIESVLGERIITTPTKALKSYSTNKMIPVTISRAIRAEIVQVKSDESLKDSTVFNMGLRVA